MGPLWGSKRPATYAKSGGERRGWSGGEGYIERSSRRLFERGARVRRQRSPMYPSPERPNTRPGLRSAPRVGCGTWLSLPSFFNMHGRLIGILRQLQGVLPLQGITQSLSGFAIALRNIAPITGWCGGRRG